MREAVDSAESKDQYDFNTNSFREHNEKCFGIIVCSKHHPRSSDDTDCISNISTL